MTRALLVFTIVLVACSDMPMQPMGTPSDSVEFNDPGLQECFESQRGGIYWREYVEDIEVLRCNRYDIVDLDGIEVMSGLLQLEICRNPQLGELAPITKLSALDTLYLNESGIENKDLEEVSKITTLLRLELVGNDVGDVSVLGNLSHLKVLLLDASGVTTGINELSKLKELTDLTLPGNPQLACDEIDELRSLLPGTRIYPGSPEPGIDCSL